MIDAYEQKHGPVDDRSIFDGEIIVPPHLRNMSLTSLRAHRLHGSLFGSLSRSRTFLNIPQNARHTLHGSVPDLSRNHHFTFNSSNSTNNSVNGDNDDHSIDNNDESEKNQRRMSSTSKITKITMNSSTTLTFSDASISTLSHGDDRTQYSNDKNSLSIQSGDGPNISINTKSDEGYKSNSICSLNDIELRESITSTSANAITAEDRTIFCQSLGRPNRGQKSNIYTTKPSDFKNARVQSMEAYNAEGYMTLIKTNPQQKNHPTSLSAYRSSSNRTISPLCTPMHDINESIADSSLPMSITSTSTFQRNKQPKLQSINNNKNNYGQSDGGFAGPLSLDNMTKFKLPRVTLNHSTATNSQQH